MEPLKFTPNPCLKCPYRGTTVCRDCENECLLHVDEKPWKHVPEINDRYQPWADLLAGIAILALAYLTFGWVLPLCGIGGLR